MTHWTRTKKITKLLSLFSCRMITMDIEQVICLALALLLAIKYIFFEQAEMESTLSLKNPITMSAPTLVPRRPTETCCRKEPPVPRTHDPAQTMADHTPANKEERGMSELSVDAVACAFNCTTQIQSSTCMLHLVSLDEVIRPLPAPATDPQPKNVFVVGEEEEELKSGPTHPNLPPKSRGLDECVAILNNPEVRHTYINP